MATCPVCRSNVANPFRELDLGSWSLSIIRDYKCCDRTFREYVRKTKESLSKELNNGKAIKRYIPLNSEPADQWDDEEEWSSEESFIDAGEW
jgi:hypothetical protein